MRERSLRGGVRARRQELQRKYPADLRYDGSMARRHTVPRHYDLRRQWEMQLSNWAPVVWHSARVREFPVGSSSLWELYQRLL